jgi:phage terminase small subunit
MNGRQHKLTDKQRAFVAEYVVDMNATRAATAAGYSARTAASLGCQLLDDDLHPLVAAEVRRALARKELAAERKADDVLRYIHTVMFFCPADYFDPGGNGGWLISREEYRRLPFEIKCLVEEMEARTVKTKAGRVSTLWVRFVAKATAMTLAAKHQLGEKVNASMQGVVQLDWDAIAGVGRPVPDEIEERLRRVGEQARVALPVPGLPVGLKELPSSSLGGVCGNDFTRNGTLDSHAGAGGEGHGERGVNGQG